jgi:hypothetical protein
MFHAFKRRSRHEMAQVQGLVQVLFKNRNGHIWSWRRICWWDSDAHERYSYYRYGDLCRRDDRPLCGWNHLLECRRQRFVNGRFC